MGTEWFNFVPLKRRKVELEFVNSVKGLKSSKVKRKSSKSNNNGRKCDIKIQARQGHCEICPACQLPLNSILHKQTFFTHVSECVETNWEDIPECPQSVKCVSTDVSHYKKFSHFQLAMARSLKNDVIQGSKLENLISENIEDVREHSSERESEGGKLSFEKANEKEQFPPRKENEDTQSLLAEKKDEEEQLSSSQKENEDTQVPTLEKYTEGKKLITVIKSEKGQCDIRSFFNSEQEKNVVGNKKINSQLTEKQVNVKAKWDIEWWKKKDDVKLITGEEQEEKQGKKSRKCPFYKKIPNTSFAVDAFSYGAIENVDCYFLTHFHSDHYYGLNSKFKGRVYCSEITARLVNMQLRVSLNQIHALTFNSPSVVNNVEIHLIDANHCPGSVMFLFRFPNGCNILHTGDFRATDKMEMNDLLKKVAIDTLYLDTTYCHPKYAFPSQDDVVNYSVSLARRLISENPRTLIVCGTYLIGKEKIFKAIAEELQIKASASASKLKILSNLDDPVLNKIMTNDWTEAQIHVLSMQQLSFNALNHHLAQYADKFDKLLAIKPTGWEFRGKKSLEDIKPRSSGNITIYGLPYSEHSSFVELKRFVQFIGTSKIIPTVNMGKVEERNRMKSLFDEWIKNKVK